MRSVGATTRLTALLLAAVLGVSPLLPATAQSPQPGPPVLRSLLDDAAARVTVRREAIACGEPDAEPEVLLLTVGAERAGEPARFHPLATFAFDRTLRPAGEGQWVAMWSFGGSSASFLRHLRAFLPLPVGAPSASTGELRRLDERLAEIGEAPDEADLTVPAPAVDLTRLGHATASQGAWGFTRKILSWAGVVNPAQFVFSAYAGRRKDRRERDFQRRYLAVQWLVDHEFDTRAPADPDGLADLNELRFHLLRNRSFFGRWLRHADSLELVYNYEGDVRVQLGKSSSWLQSAANEHWLRYEPIYRDTRNGARIPVGGVLYYDPSLGAVPDPGWWRVANPFDLPYNPHTHPAVQELARQHPDARIPLGIYSFQTNLRLRPIILVDFFAPSNPRARESTHQAMILAKHWLSITSGFLAAERIPYRLTAWAANKKGFTLLVNKSSRLGVEELRVALESGLYFDPALRQPLLARVDQRVLNPLVKAGAVEERLAQIQYESLRAQESRAVCERVARIRREMGSKVGVPADLPPDELHRELARRLADWRRELPLQDFLDAPSGDFGTLGALAGPLGYFAETDSPSNSRRERRLARVYAELYHLDRRLPDGREASDLPALVELARRAWENNVVAPRSPLSFAERRAEVEREVEERLQREREQETRRRVKSLHDFLKEGERHLAAARRNGCQPDAALPIELEAYLLMLRDVATAARADDSLRVEFNRHRASLRKQLRRLDTELAACRPAPENEMRWETKETALQLTRSLEDLLAGRTAGTPAGDE